MSRKLNATVIKNLKPRAARYLVTDTHTPGLVLKVSPNGSKYFYYRYRPSGSSRILEEPIGTWRESRVTGTLAGGTTPPYIKRGHRVIYDEEDLLVWAAQFRKITNTSQSSIDQRS